MTDNNETGGPAFPGQYDHGDQIESWTGMTLRDYFAAKALAALIGHPDKDGLNRGAKAVPALARYAYEYADEMMEARK